MYLVPVTSLSLSLALCVCRNPKQPSIHALCVYIAGTEHRDSLILGSLNYLSPVIYLVLRLLLSLNFEKLILRRAIMNITRKYLVYIRVYKYIYIYTEVGWTVSLKMGLNERGEETVMGKERDGSGKTRVLG